MAGGFGSIDDDVISNINVTPLVDVVLVLLIIFLIAAPAIYQSAIQVQLPKAKSGDQPLKTPLSFTINKEGTLFWNKDAVNWDTLEGRLSALGKTIASETAVISADEQTPHGTVIRLMDLLRQAGLTQFALSTQNQR